MLKRGKKIYVEAVRGVIASKECGGVEMELDSGRTPRCFLGTQPFLRNYCIGIDRHVKRTRYGSSRPHFC